MKNIRKILVISAIFFSALSFNVSQNNSNNSSQTLFENFEDPQTISLPSYKFTDLSHTLAPYKTQDFYLSDEKSASFEFTSVGGSWQEYSPAGTLVEAQVQFKTGDKWGQWLDLEEELESQDGDLKTKYAMASSNLAQSFRYKFTMYGDANHSPVISGVKWTFIKSGENMNLAPAPIPQYSSSNIVSVATNYALSSGSPNIISRSQWGANESLRYTNSDSTNIEPELVELSSDFYTKFASELKLSKVIYKDSKNKEYTWPLQYPKTVKKFIIHHTASSENLTDPKQAIRDIYYYHTVSRGWGDIGYNYIIDTNGLIYEGRYGGEGVIGAHAGSGNNGSIGIAVIGNYEQSSVPSKVLQSLETLIAEKSKIHNIDPEGKTMFRGENSLNVLGHRDFMSTTCPGVNLYSKLPIIRKEAKEKMSAQVVTKPKFVTQYDYQDLSDIFYIELNTDQSKSVTLKLQNIGTETWNNTTYIVVDQNPEFDGLVSFPTKRGAVLAKMNELSVKPGQNATFTFTVKPETKTGVVYMNISPVINDKKKVSPYIVMPVNVASTFYDYKYISTKGLTPTMKRGETTDITISLKNTGSSTWFSSGASSIKLGTDHPRDGQSVFESSNPTRIGDLIEDKVLPGEIGTFQIKVKTPNKPGYYKQYFTPVVEGKTWMQDSGLFIDTTVFGGDYGSEFVSRSPAIQWRANMTYKTWIKLRNIGQNSWSASDLTVAITNINGLTYSNFQLLESTVKPGDIGTIQFMVKVDKNSPTKSGFLPIIPKIKGSLISLGPINLDYRIVQSSATTPPPIIIPKPTTPTQNIPTTNNSTPNLTTQTQNLTQSTTDHQIRVKLGFNGSPEITANGYFDIYNGSTFLETISPTQSIKVDLIGSNFKIQANGKNYLKTGPIRFIPNSGTILKIKNYENRPAWNTALNDNEFRGVLELNKDNQKLIVINELAIEDYLKGIGEVGNYDPTEKIKTIIVAARTYAMYYTLESEKYPGKPYNLDDNPDSSQKYIGYGFEMRAPNITKAVNETKGQIVTYNGQLIKTPYFNQSDGTKTKSGSEVFNWDLPYLVSVDDSFCKADKFLGHGVGLSGCGATGMANLGYTYKQILQHYYTGTQISQK